MIDTHKPHIKIIAMDIEYASIAIISSTNHIYEMLILKEPFLRWMNGELIQRCFPDFDLETRELMISGMDPEQQKIFFDMEEEEES